MKKVTIILLVGLAVVVGFGSLFMSDLVAESTTYSDFKTAKENAEEVHVVGQWIRRDEAFYDTQRDLFHFWMQDTVSNVSQVIYGKPKPDNFESAERVVVMGKFHEDVFYADEILMKCPSKYNETGMGEDFTGIPEENNSF